MSVKGTSKTLFKKVVSYRYEILRSFLMARSYSKEEKGAYAEKFRNSEMSLYMIN